MKLTNQKSVLPRRSEGKPKRSFGAWLTQKIYLLILLGIVSYIAYLVYNRYVFLGENGLIEVERTIISSLDGGRIVSLTVENGQVVKKGALMAQIQSDNEACQTDINREKINKLVLSIETDKHKLELLKAKSVLLQKEKRSNVLKRVLEVDNSEEKRLLSVNSKLQDLEFEMKVLGFEIDQKGTLLKQLRESSLAQQQLCKDEEIVAPATGTVEAISRQAYEVVKRGQPILNFIADNAVVHVETYIEDTEISVIPSGKLVTVVLPDQTKTTGIVASVKSSAALRAERVWDQYEPAKTKLAVILSPATKNDARLWKLHDRMNIKVRMKR